MARSLRNNSSAINMRLILKSQTNLPFPATYCCGISGGGKNKRGLASSALNQTVYQNIFINFALMDSSETKRFFLNLI